MPSARVPALDWDRLSRRYHRQHWLERDAVRIAVGLLDPTPSERVLDVATGTGEVLRALARRPAPPWRVNGLDSSSHMLARVPALPDGWDLLLGDARALPLDGASVDVAAAGYLLQLLGSDDVTRVLHELMRVLTRGGRMVTITPAIPPAGPSRRLAGALDRLARRRPDRYATLRALDPSTALVEAGFDVLDARWSRRGYPSICVLAQTRRGGPRGQRARVDE